MLAAGGDGTDLAARATGGIIAKIYTFVRRYPQVVADSALLGTLDKSSE